MSLALLLLLQDPILDGLKKADLRAKPIDLLDGRSGIMLSAETALIGLQVEPIKFDQITPEAIRWLVGADSTAMAAFLLKHDRTEEAHAILQNASRADVEAVLAEGDPVPDGGFVWDKTLGFVPGGKPAPWKKALALAAKLQQKADETREELDTLAVDSPIGPQIKRLADRALRRRTRALNEAAIQKVLGSSTFKSKLGKARADLKKSRLAAVNTVFNAGAYSDKDKEKGQQKIDAAVAEVMAALDGEWLKDVEAKHAADIDGAPDPAHVRLRIRNAARIEMWLKSDEPQAQKCYEFSRRVAAYNAMFVLPDGVPEDARKQVAVLNAYRHQIGIQMLFLDARFLRAAQKHSGSMDAKQMIYHNDGGDTMMARLAAEGWTGACGENVCGGAENAEQAHQMWYHSPGHHRNMLNPAFRAIGVGRTGVYWCQNFADPPVPPELAP